MAGTCINVLTSHLDEHLIPSKATYRTVMLQAASDNPPAYSNSPPEVVKHNSSDIIGLSLDPQLANSVAKTFIFSITPSTVLKSAFAQGNTVRFHVSILPFRPKCTVHYRVLQGFNLSIENG